MNKTIADKVLLYRLQIEKDPEAYAELYDRYVKQIYRFVYFKVASHEEAEDVTSDVFLKAWHYIQERKEVKSFSGLLYRIARNCIVDIYRAKSAKPEARLDSLEDFDLGDSGKWQEQINASLDTKVIVAALKKLKQEYQEVITLRYIDELSVEEIAEIMEKGKLTVRVTLHRALNKLKQVLAE